MNRWSDEDQWEPLAPATSAPIPLPVELLQGADGTLAKLPQDVCRLVLRKLSHEDLLRLRLVSKAVFIVVNGHIQSVFTSLTVRNAKKAPPKGGLQALPTFKVHAQNVIIHSSKYGFDLTGSDVVEWVKAAAGLPALTGLCVISPSGSWSGLMDVSIAKAVCSARCAASLTRLELHALDRASMAAVDLTRFPLLQWLHLGRVFAEEGADERDAKRLCTAPAQLRVLGLHRVPIPEAMHAALLERFAALEEVTLMQSFEKDHEVSAAITS